MGLLFWECLFPHFNGLELGHPAFRLEGALALGIQQALLHTPLGCLGGVGICHIRKSRGVHRFRSACGVPHQQRRQCTEGAWPAAAGQGSTARQGIYGYVVSCRVYLLCYIFEPIIHPYPPPRHFLTRIDRKMRRIDRCTILENSAPYFVKLFHFENEPDCLTLPADHAKLSPL